MSESQNYALRVEEYNLVNQDSRYGLPTTIDDVFVQHPSSSNLYTGYTQLLQPTNSSGDSRRIGLPNDIRANKRRREFDQEDSAEDRPRSFKIPRR